MAIKPTINKPEFATAATGSDISEPTERKTTGFVAPGGLPEKPNRQELNFLLKSITEWTAYLESITDENLSFLNSTNDRFKEADDVALGLTAGYIKRNTGKEFQPVVTGTENEVTISDSQKAIFIGSTGRVYRTNNTTDTVLTLTNSDTNYPRYDLISLDTITGTYTITNGIASASPIKPTIPTDEEGIAYIFRRMNNNIPDQKDIKDIRQQASINQFPVSEYRTNYSLRQGLAAQPLWFKDWALRKQEVKFGTKFDSIRDQDIENLRNKCFSIPPDAPDINFSANWTNSAETTSVYEIMKSTGVNGSSFTWKFFGTGVGLTCRPSNLNYAKMVTRIRTLSESFGERKTWDLYNQGSSGFKDLPLLYWGLPQNWYEIEVTINNLTDVFHLEALHAEARCCIKLLPEYTLKEGNVTSVDDVPFGSIFWDETPANLPHQNSTFLNALFMASPTNTTSPKVRFKFKGKAIWLFTRSVSLSAPTMVFKIDGVQTEVKVQTYNHQVHSSVDPLPIAHLINNEELTDDIHELEISIQTSGTSQGIEISGYAWYSEDQRSTTSRDVICGKESEIISVTDTRFTNNGYSISTTSTDQLFGTNGTGFTPNIDELTITTPNIPEKPLRAIYAVINVEDGIGNSHRTRISLGGVNNNVIYIQHAMSNRDWGQQIVFLYDAFLLNQPIDGLTLRMTPDAGNSYINGVIFEYGDIVEKDRGYFIPKVTLMNAPLEHTPHYISTMQYLSVKGIKKDNSSGIKHNVFVPPFSTGGSTVAVASFGCFTNFDRFEVPPKHMFGTLGPYISSMESVERITGYINMFNYWPQLMRQAVTIGSVDNWMQAKFKEVI
jgi:hypothetical protein